MKGKVLIVEDDRDMCDMLDEHLSRRGFLPICHQLGETAFSQLDKEDFDVLLADINLPGMSGIELCKQVVLNRPDIPVIVMTAFGSLETAIGAVRAGAYDFVTKPVDLDLLSVALDRAVTHRDLLTKVKILSQAADKVQGFEELVGESQSMQAMFSTIDRIADTETSVLISGESGTGKEIVARTLHNRSKRRSGPFIPINCSALPISLLESELFGHKKGSFTDAKSDHKGLFLQAEGGTLFLDEVGEIPLMLQPKLLRALEERYLRPVGGNTEVPYDVRILSATNRDLEFAVDEGLFREDLFYRLNVIQMEVPPLRERGADVLLLCRHFISKFSHRNGKQIDGISDAAAEKLLAYPWPGNVRELRNAIEYAVAMTRFDKLSVKDFPQKIRTHRNDEISISGDDPFELVSLEEVERRYILHVLKTVGNNRSSAARILKLDRKTLYRKLQSYGVSEK